MSGLTRRQARLVERQIKKLYGRNYIPLRTGDSTLSIGDILASRKDILPIIDSSVFGPGITAHIEGHKVSKNITSSSAINITSKLHGQAVLSEHFKLEEAGIAVNFTSENQMFLKVKGLRQQSIRNFVEFRKKILDLYTRGEVSSRVYIVRGLLYADKFYLQYSGSKGGTIEFKLNIDAQIVDAEEKADFSLQWKKDVGFHIDGSNGGVLAYRVSGVRLKRHLLPEDIQAKILTGVSEADVLNTLSFKVRKELMDNDALEIVDLTDEVLVDEETETEPEPETETE